MTWIVTADGFEANVLYPTPDMFEIERIAHSLSQINRFNGHAVRPYSVAEHSLLVLELAERMGLDVFGQMAALLHDAHEAFVGDMSTPVKQCLGRSWSGFEDRIAHHLSLRFGFHTALVHASQEIKRADLIALAIERHHLLPHVQPSGVPSTPWSCLSGLGEVHHMADLMDRHVVGMAWHEWRDAFIDRFQELQFARAELAHERFGTEASLALPLEALGQQRLPVDEGAI